MQGIQHSNSATASPGMSGSEWRVNPSIAVISTGPELANSTTRRIQKCTDIACASACSSSWASWSSASASFLTAHADNVSTSTLITLEATTTQLFSILSSTGTPYATCDGFPRYEGDLDDPTYIEDAPVPATTTTRYILSTRVHANYTEPAPTCKIGPKACRALLNEWHDNHYLPFPFNQSTAFWSNWWDGSPLDFPHCDSGGTYWVNGSIAADSSRCWVKGASARLFYWPEPETPGQNSTCPPQTYTLARFPETPAQAATGPVTKVMTFSDTVHDCCTTTMTLTSPTMYLSIQGVEGRNANWGFSGGIVPATVIAVDPTELYTNIIAPPLITNEALSSSAMSVIANQEWSKYTDLFGYNWEQHSTTIGGLGGPNLPMTSVLINVADLGKPPPPLSYYFGAVGWHCLNANPYALHNQPVSAGLPPMDCGTIYDAYYRPWVQIPETPRKEKWASCHPMFGWDPPIALTQAPAVVPTTPVATPANPTQARPTSNNGPADPASPTLGWTPTALPDTNPSITEGSRGRARPANSSPGGSSPGDHSAGDSSPDGSSPGDPHGINDDKPFATTIHGQTISTAAGGFVVNGHTIADYAAPTTIAGVAYSIDSAKQLVAASSTTLGGQGGITGTTILNGNTVASVSNGVVVDGQHTITPGAGATTISDHVYSLNSHGQLIVASPTTLLAPGEQIDAGNLMDAIMSVGAAKDMSTSSTSPLSNVFDPSDSGQATSSGANVPQQTGSASAYRLFDSKALRGCLLVSGLTMLLVV